METHPHTTVWNKHVIKGLRVDCSHSVGPAVRTVSTWPLNYALMSHNCTSVKYIWCFFLLDVCSDRSHFRLAPLSDSSGVAWYLGASRGKRAPEPRQLDGIDGNQTHTAWPTAQTWIPTDDLRPTRQRKNKTKEICNMITVVETRECGAEVEELEIVLTPFFDVPISNKKKI